MPVSVLQQVMPLNPDLHRKLGIREVCPYGSTRPSGGWTDHRTDISEGTGGTHGPIAARGSVTSLRSFSPAADAGTTFSALMVEGPTPVTGAAAALSA